MSGRLQKYLIKMMRDQLSEAVGDQIMDSLVNAQSVEEQRKIFQSIPQDKVEAILRWAQVHNYNFVLSVCLC